MKNNFCSFERPFKIQKNGVFLFEISFFVLEILTSQKKQNDTLSAVAMTTVLLLMLS